MLDPVTEKSSGGGGGMRRRGGALAPAHFPRLTVGGVYVIAGALVRHARPLPLPSPLPVGVAGPRAYLAGLQVNVDSEQGTRPHPDRTSTPPDQTDWRPGWLVGHPEGRSDHPRRGWPPDHPRAWDCMECKGWQCPGPKATVERVVDDGTIPDPSRPAPGPPSAAPATAGAARAAPSASHGVGYATRGSR